MEEAAGHYKKAVSTAMRHRKSSPGQPLALGGAGASGRWDQAAICVSDAPLGRASPRLRTLLVVAGAAAWKNSRHPQMLEQALADLQGWILPPSGGQPVLTKLVRLAVPMVLEALG